jgi:RNA polymerase sigma factor (sigma-70 family)
VLWAKPPTPEERFLEQQQKQAIIHEVKAMLDTLPEKQRQAIYMKYIEELDHKAIAEQVNASSANAVTTRIRRGIDTLLKRFSVKHSKSK